MSGSIRNIMATAYKNVLKNPREAKFVYKMQRLFAESEKRRHKVLDNEGIDVPPFLISSISTTCNLACKGCYARKNGIAADVGSEQKKMLSPDSWRKIFEEAARMGVCFSLIAGGEPLIHKNLLTEIATIKDMIFPVFTNGTLFGPTYLKFFDEHLNLIPIISLEGLEQETDERRGKGIYRKAVETMTMLSEKRLFFGVSITVTTENLTFVTSPSFIDTLCDFGCKIVFYVEYVPLEEGTEHLALDEQATALMEQTMGRLRTAYPTLIFLSFPGDEKALGGCLASGRGFFHIAPDGAAEPCPFSPFSDCNVAENGLLQALKSPLFNKLRDAHALGWEHTGGCTLYEHRDEVAALLR